MKLVTDAPMNKPRRPPQLAKISGMLDVSDRFNEMKLCSLKDIKTLLDAFNLKRISKYFSRKISFVKIKNFS